MKKFLSDLDEFRKKEIVFRSVYINFENDEKNDYIEKNNGRLIKKFHGLPSYKNKMLCTYFNKKITSTIVPMGEVYGLIGIDIDAVDNTIELYNEICNKNNFNRNTFTIKTMQNGYHEYFKLSTPQKESLKSFMSLDGKIFDLNIDVKYNNQFLIGPGILGDEYEFTYTIYKNTDPIILPDFLFQEILRKKGDETKIPINNHNEKSCKTNKLDGTDKAIIRRLRFIKFPNVFVDEPKLPNERQIQRGLKDEVKNDIKYRHAFFTILADHYHDFLVNDNNLLKMPSRMTLDTKRFISDNDPVKEFIDEKLDVIGDSKDFVKLSILYQEFTSFNYVNQNQNFSLKAFNKILTDKGFQCVKRKGYIGFSKIKLIEENEFSD